MQSLTVERIARVLIAGPLPWRTNDKRVLGVKDGTCFSVYLLVYEEDCELGEVNWTSLRFSRRRFLSECRATSGP